MFDDADQQRHWYDFIRYLKNSTVYEGDTTAQRLMMFIDAHTDNITTTTILIAIQIWKTTRNGRQITDSA